MAQSKDYGWEQKESEDAILGEVKVMILYRRRSSLGFRVAISGFLNLEKYNREILNCKLLK
jgi:hypothetical protein